MAATETKKKDTDGATGELPGMPPKPKLPRARNGHEIENARVGIRGGCSFKLSDNAGVDFLDSFALEGAMKLTVYGRVTADGDTSQTLKDGTMVVRALTFTVDYIEGAPNREASEALAEVDGE